MEAQEEGAQPARSVANPLNDDGGVAPRAEPREELDDERGWVALSVAPRAFGRAGQWLSAADGAPTPLAWALYAVLGLYPPFFLFVGANGMNIFTTYDDPVFG